MSIGAANIIQFPFDGDRIDTGIEEAFADRANTSKDATHAAYQPGLDADRTNQRSEALKAAENYIRAGWWTFPGKRSNHDERDKHPITGWSWTKRHLSLAEAPQYFDKDQHNVLVALGENSRNLTDIDLDWPEAAAAAEVVF